MHLENVSSQHTGRRLAGGSRREMANGRGMDVFSARYEGGKEGMAVKI